jgi:uncharacterized phage protein (TIGR02216 family)
LRLSPDAFWRLSLSEWRALLPRRRPALARSDLQQLMQHFPD